MDVASTDPLVLRATDTVASARTPMCRLGLIIGLPGFGKTSLLSAASSTAAQRLNGRILWLSGSVVANERHLLRLLPREIYRRVDRERGMRPDSRTTASVLAIDDIDALVFKRERVAGLLTRIIVNDPSVRLLASCHPAAADRFLRPDGWLTRLAKDAGSPLATVSITPLDDDAARALILRREPRLAAKVVGRIISAAGGHPSALVFLSRLLQLRARSDRRSAGEQSGLSTVNQEIGIEDKMDDLISWAAEFAGAVYAESWASLGPQQRAILWQLARRHSPASASEIAARIDLPSSHVSAQLTRLLGKV